MALLIVSRKLVIPKPWQWRSIRWWRFGESFPIQCFCFRDPSLHSVSLWMTISKATFKALIIITLKTSVVNLISVNKRTLCKQENAVLRPISRRFPYGAKMMQTESRIKFIWLCRGAAHLRVSKDTAPETRCQVFWEIILWLKCSKGLTCKANRIEDTQYSVLSWLLSIRVYCKENSYLYILYIYNIYRYNLSYALFRFCIYLLNTEYWVTCLFVFGGRPNM